MRKIIRTAEFALTIAILFILAIIVIVKAAEPPIPKLENAIAPASVFIDPLAGPPVETHASFKIDWVWPVNIAEYGPIPIVDVATNFSFLILSSPLLSNPEWKVKYVFPGKSLTPMSNYWFTNIWEDMATSAYFQIVVTNDLNRTTSTTTSIPSATATSMLLSTPPAKPKSITKNK